ncbi:hypothetical protein SNE40_008147 [Patella caerulea]|uniref:Uncharacterized protein n=1 Tax=Patella caerulea TaxID=87958 RepID=A0AAN8JV42_PATCE
MVRPKINQSEQTAINIQMFLRQLVELNSREQVMRILGWFVITWVDEKLMWNPDNYGGIIEMNVLQKDIWIPDLTATNSFEDDDIFGSDELRVYVNHTGNISWEPDFAFTTSCPVDVTMFPVDSQTCAVTVMPWMTSDTEILFNETKLVVDTLLAHNGQFAIVGSCVTRHNESVSGNLDNKLVKSSFTLNLKRKPTFYLLNVIGPIAAISFLCGVSFLVPSESGEKLTVAITVLLSLTVFLGVIDDYLPKTSDCIPHFVIYVTLLIGMSFLAVVGNVITLFVHSLSPSVRIPRCVKFLLIPKYTKAKSKEITHSNVFLLSLRRSSTMSITAMSMEPSCCDICGTESVCNHWPEVAKMADKVVYIVFTLTLVCINVTFSFIYL